MTKENENVSIANKSSYTEEEIKAAYEKGKSEGRIEGMLSYQKRLIKNLFPRGDNFDEIGSYLIFLPSIRKSKS